MTGASVAVAFALGLVCTAVAEVKCPLPGNWQLDVENSDEFNGSFYHDRWYDYPPRFPGRPGEFRFLARNVAQRDGDLLITADKVPDDEIPYEQRLEGMKGFTCGAVKSRRKMFRGYFEARIKVNPAAVRNAFWLYDPLSDDLQAKYSAGNVSEEIDVFETAGRHQPEDAHLPYFLTMNTHHYITPYYEAVCNNHNVPLGSIRQIDFCPSDDYHVYGLLWTDRELVWYLDGAEMARMSILAYGHGGFPRALHVVFDCEFAEWNGARFKTLDLKTLPAVQKIDWFRHWVLQ